MGQEMTAEELKAALAEMQIKGAAALKFKRALKASPTVNASPSPISCWLFRDSRHGRGRAAARQAAV